MNSKIKKLSLVSIPSFCCGALGIVHLSNKLMFWLSGRKMLNNLWRSEHGDIAFHKQGNGPPLLLVHSFGIGAGSCEWESCFSALSESNTVYAIELPGYGSSAKPCLSYNSYYYAKIINDFIKCIIGQRVSVAALWDSGGVVLAGAAMEKELYDRIIVINPYEEGFGAEYRNSFFVRNVIGLPVIGTLVYNFISGRQNILAYLETLAGDGYGYSDVCGAMEKFFKNAHMLGAGNKHAIMGLIYGYFKTPVFQLMERCQVPLNVVISKGSTFPMVEERERLLVSALKTPELLPGFDDTSQFTDAITEFARS